MKIVSMNKIYPKAIILTILFISGCTMSVDQYRNLMETAGRNGMRSRELARAQQSITDSLSLISDEYSEIQQPKIFKLTEKISKIDNEILKKYGNKDGVVS